LQTPDLQDVLNRGTGLRERGKSIGAPPAAANNPTSAPVGSILP